MDVLLQTFLDGLENAATIEQLRDVMTAMAAGFGLHAFAYISRPAAPDGKPLLITNYAESWATHYSVRQYHRLDPIVLRAWQYPGSFEWGQELARATSVLVRAFFDEAACFGIRYGYTIPIRCWRGTTAALTFASDRCRSTSRSSIRESAGALHAMACEFHARVRENLSVKHILPDMTLTYRQCQCLDLAVEGKSLSEIAQLAGISPHTAKFHIDNAKIKFGVKTMREAAILYAIAKRSPAI